MLKSLLVVPALMLAALPAQAGRNHYHGPYHHHYGPRPVRVVCSDRGCTIKYKEPKIRVSEHCVYKPWSDRTVCRY